jgi:hypothetical protein
MLAVGPDRFTVFCCDATLGALVVVGAIYFLLRAFRKDKGPGRGPPDFED